MSLLTSGCFDRDDEYIIEFDFYFIGSNNTVNLNEYEIILYWNEEIYDVDQYRYTLDFNVIPKMDYQCEILFMCIDAVDFERNYLKGCFHVTDNNVNFEEIERDFVDGNIELGARGVEIDMNANDVSLSVIIYYNIP